MKDSQKHLGGTAGYDQEERYFYELDRKLIEQARAKKSNEPSGKLLLLPQPQKREYKKAG